MPYDKASTRPPEIPEDVWESNDPYVVIKFIVDTPLPYWARKMWFMKWARFYSVHVDAAMIEALKENLPEPTKARKPIDTGEAL